MEADEPARRRDAAANANQAPAGLIYGLGFLGAIVYYIQAADGFWSGVLGVLKAFVWPAFLVYEALRALGA